MADLKFSISFDLGTKLDMLRVVNKQVFPLLNQAVRAVTAQTAYNWSEEVYKAKLWSGEKDAYVKSISWSMTGDFTGEVVATYKYAEEIESGRPARDLKKMLNTSLKVRRTKTGSRFLVIPFRHNVKNMPPELYAQAKSLEASKITGTGQRRSGEITAMSPKFGMSPLGEKQQRRSPFLSNTATKGPMMVQKFQYQWGGRIAAGFFGPNQKGKTDIAAGMVRFDTSTPGGAKSSSYLTFRVMSDKSNGWIVPSQPGQHIAQKVTDDMRPKANLAFQEAIKRTLSKK